jgi:hypothetical protein
MSEQDSSAFSPVEAELARKLLTTSHLNAPERAILGNRGRFSLLLRVVEQLLAERSYFPEYLRPDANFDEILIERRGGEYWTHERHESGVGTFGPLTSQRAWNLANALRFRLARGDIDGVVVDFDR